MNDRSSLVIVFLVAGVMHTTKRPIEETDDSSMSGLFVGGWAAGRSPNLPAILQPQKLSMFSDVDYYDADNHSRKFKSGNSARKTKSNPNLGSGKKLTVRPPSGSQSVRLPIQTDAAPAASHPRSSSNLSEFSDAFDATWSERKSTSKDKYNSLTECGNSEGKNGFRLSRTASNVSEYVDALEAPTSEGRQSFSSSKNKLKKSLSNVSDYFSFKKGSGSFSGRTSESTEDQTVEHKTSIRMISAGSLARLIICCRRTETKPPFNSASTCCSKTSMAFDRSENVSKIWADKYRPEALGSFIIHTRQARFLKQLISAGNCHHLIFQGPAGSGKKTLIMALLREIFGPAAWKVFQENRAFLTRDGLVYVPIATSAYHVELNLSLVGSSYIKQVILTLFKEMSHTSEMARENADISGLLDFKVLMLLNVDKVSSEAQQHVRWLMDCYADGCKVIVCSQHSSKILDAIKSRCLTVNLEAPTADEVVLVLKHIAKKEKLAISDTFVRRIASMSSNNLRQAIISLQLCRDEQLLQSGWEDEIAAVADRIVSEQTPKRLFEVRGNLQRLLLDGIAAQLILQRLAEALLGLLDVEIIEEAEKWCKLYAKKVGEKSNPIFELEEFVAKIMSIYRNHRLHNLQPN